MNTITPGPLVLSIPALAAMTVTIEPSLAHQGDLVIHLTGELDCWSEPTLARALFGLCPPVHVPGKHHAKVVFDLRGLSFLDSSGLRALEAGRRKLLEAGWLVTAGPAQPPVQWLLRFADRTGWLTQGPLTSEGAPTAPQSVNLPDMPRTRVIGRG